MLALAIPAGAQQIANSDFDGEWYDCIPFTYYADEGYSDQLSKVVVGQNPAGWAISNVTGMAAYNDGSPAGLSSTGRRTDRRLWRGRGRISCQFSQSIHAPADCTGLCHARYHMVYCKSRFLE